MSPQIQQHANQLELQFLSVVAHFVEE